LSFFLTYTKIIWKSKLMTTFKIIAAIDSETRGIGFNGALPWKIKADLAYFQKITTGGTVIMGRKTWESLPPPNCLSNRQNIVITNNSTITYPHIQFADSLDEALNLARTDRVFVIGGGMLYAEAIQRRDCQQLLLTLVTSGSDIFDTFFPEYEHLFRKSKETSHGNYSFTVWDQLVDNHEEEQYLQTLDKLVTKSFHPNRTGVEAASLFGQSFKFDLRCNKFPLQTTRKMWLRGIFQEFKWIMSGDTDATKLAKQGVKIWLPNTTREFLDQRGLTHLPVGDIGETYGFTLRHFGAKYQDAQTDYTNQGFDQLHNAIQLLKNDPTSRRIVIDLWKPDSMNNTALPPCMFCYTFHYDPDHNELNLHVTQRSSDFLVARNWNDAFAAIFLKIMAKVAGMNPGDLWITITNAHLYQCHLEAAQIQRCRRPLKFPTLTIDKDLNTLQDILNLDFTDLHLENYVHHPTIKLGTLIA